MNDNKNYVYDYIRKYVQLLIHKVNIIQNINFYIFKHVYIPLVLYTLIYTIILH